jgi:hypothetical protein
VIGTGTSGVTDTVTEGLVAIAYVAIANVPITYSLPQDNSILFIAE